MACRPQICNHRLTVCQLSVSETVHQFQPQVKVWSPTPGPRRLKRKAFYRRHLEIANWVMAEYNIHCHVTREKSFVPTNCFNQAFSGFIAIQIAYRIAQTDLIDSIESTVHIISISALQKYHGVEIKGVGKHWSQRQDRFVPWLVAKNLTGASCHCFVSRLYSHDSTAYCRPSVWTLGGEYCKKNPRIDDLWPLRRSVVRRYLVSNHQALTVNQLLGIFFRPPKLWIWHFQLREYQQ